MFGRNKKPVAPLLDEPQLDSTQEYIDTYNAAWEKYYEDQDAYEAKNLITTGL